jgi:hypothetical protein
LLRCANVVAQSRARSPVPIGILNPTVATDEVRKQKANKHKKSHMEITHQTKIQTAMDQTNETHHFHVFYMMFIRFISDC